ncbi:sugar kinase [Bacillus gobiensis]|uniref:sugar kinase n=1 Tax=Bacillus gobiensis TaxID=1441095 RepID=UPI003D2150A6
MDVISIGETMVLFTPQEDGLLRYNRNFSAKIAGAETNTLIGLTRLGIKTGWISKVGSDEFGRLILSQIRGEGIDTSQVISDNKHPTGIFFKEKTYESSMKVMYYRKGSAASTITKHDIDSDYISRSSYLYVTGITPALSESSLEAVFYAMQLAKEHHTKIVFDPNVRKKLWSEEKAKATLLEMAKLADIMLPGTSEGEFLFGTKDEKEIAKKVLDMGCELAVVKMGASGAYYESHNQHGYVSGYKVDRVVDPVGAGDGFAAGVISGLIENAGIEKAVQRGCAIGAIVTTVNGDIEGLPDKEILRHFVHKSSEDVDR